MPGDDLDRRHQHRRADDAILYTLNREVGEIKEGQKAIASRLDRAEEGRGKMRRTLHDIASQMAILTDERRNRLHRRSQVIRVLRRPLTWLAAVGSAVLAGIGTGMVDRIAAWWSGHTPPGP